MRMLASGGHGVGGVADKIDEDPGEVFDGKRGLSGTGHGRNRQADCGTGDGGQQRLQVAQLFGCVGYGHDGQRCERSGGESIRIC